MTKMRLYRIYLLLFFALPYAVIAQDADPYGSVEQAMTHMKEDDTEPMFTRNAVPERYQNESTIILAKKMVFRFYNKLSPHIYSYIHLRVLLNDLSAVEECSEYHFDEAGDMSRIEIKVIKRNGKVMEVDLADAVTEDVKVNGSLKNLTISDKQSKIAIKNLEVGDIIDYIYINRKEESRYIYTYFLSGEYPVANTKIVFQNDPEVMVFGHKSLNHAPDFITSVKDGVELYIMEDSLQDKYEEEVESERSLDEPYLKVQAVSVKSIANRDFKYTQGEDKNKVNLDDLKHAAFMTRKMFLSGTSEYYYPFAKGYGYIRSDKKFLSDYYYFLRNRIYTSDLAFEGETSNSGIRFMGQLVKAAEKRRIKYEIVMFRDKEDGPLEDALYEEELYWGVNFITKEGDIAFYTFDPFSNPDEVPKRYEGVDAYYARVGSTPEKTKIRTSKFPVSSNITNVYKNLISAEFVNGTDSLKISQHSVMKGYYMENQKYSFLNRFDCFKDYVQQLKEEKIITEKNRRYYYTNMYAFKNIDNGFIEEVEKQNQLDYQGYENKRIKKNLMNDHSNDGYHLLRYDSFKVLSDGRDSAKKQIEWEENYVIGNVTGKANNDIVFEIGELVGSMYQINQEKNRITRMAPIYIHFSRSFICELKVKIPDGYHAENVSALNLQFQSEVGDFSSEATIAGNEIIIKMVKTYKAGKFAKEKWPDYIRFLDKGTDFERSAIILTQNK